MVKATADSPLKLLVTIPYVDQMFEGLRKVWPSVVTSRNNTMPTSKFYLW